MQNISGICSKPLTSLEWLPNDNFNDCQDLMVWWQSYYWTFDIGNGAAGLLVPTSLSPPLSTSSLSAPSLSPPVLCWPVRAWPPPFLTFQYFFITRFSNFSKYLGVFSSRFEIQTPEKAIRGGLYAIVHHHGKGRQGFRIFTRPGSVTAVTQDHYCSINTNTKSQLCKILCFIGLIVSYCQVM